MDLETEVTMHQNIIVEAKAEVPQQANFYQWKAEQHRLILKVLEKLNYQLRTKVGYTVELEDDLEGELNLEANLHKDCAAYQGQRTQARRPIDVLPGAQTRR